MKPVILLLTLLLTFSCTKKADQIEAENAVEGAPNRVIEQPQEPDTTTINHYFQANGGTILYLKNGDIKGCARCDSDGDLAKEILNTKAYGTYADYDNYIIGQANDTLFFFDDYGRVLPDWKIVKGVAITNDRLVISYHPPARKPAQRPKKIVNTQLLIFSPEAKTFADEESPEAEAYFTAMDDWNWYSLELSDYFKKQNVETTYVSGGIALPIEADKVMLIDTRLKINNAQVAALLYKKGKRPIILSLIGSDNDPVEIERYLK